MKLLILPVNVELVKILTIFELTGGRDFSEPPKIRSTVRSSILTGLNLYVHLISHIIIHADLASFVTTNQLAIAVPLKGNQSKEQSK